MDSKPRRRGFNIIPRMFKRNSREQLKCGEDMLYGTEEYNKEYSEYITDDYNQRFIELGTDLENLHLSRADNPYVSSCEALADADDTSLSPTPGSPRNAEMSPETVSPDVIMDLQSHLIRSPPPVYWPNKVFEFSSDRWTSPLSPSTRSDRAFSPESGSDGMETERSYQSYGARSQSEERIISPVGDLLSPGTLSPVRGQTPVYSPMRGHTPDMTDFSPPNNRSRQHSTPDGGRIVSPRSMSQSYHRSISQTSTSHQRLRSRTPDEEFSPSRFNIYTLHHQRAVNLRNKSESSYLVTDPARSTYLISDPSRDLISHYQPASRRSLANLGARPTRKSSDFLSWLPRRSRSRSRSDAKSMENLQSSQTPNSRPLQASSRLSHKSLNFVGEDASAGLLIEEGPSPSATSPRPTRRKTFTGIKKSFSLKQKKSNQGPLYVDIDTQDL